MMKIMILLEIEGVTLKRFHHKRLHILIATLDKLIELFLVYDEVSHILEQV